MAMMLISELSEAGTQDEGFYRALGAIAVLWVLGLLLLPILRKVDARELPVQSSTPEPRNRIAPPQ
jgi:hypothetical protein